MIPPLLHEELVDQEIQSQLKRGAALTVFISRGEEVYSRFTAVVNEIYNEAIEVESQVMPDFELDRDSCLEYFKVILDLYLLRLISWQTMLLERLVSCTMRSLALQRIFTFKNEQFLCTVNGQIFI